MELSNSKDQDEQTPQEGPTATEASPTKSDRQRSSGQTFARKGQRLDVDETLARSFKNLGQ